MRARPIESPKHVATERAAGCVPRAILAGFAATLAMLLAFLMAYNLARAASAALPADAPSTGLARLWLHNCCENTFRQPAFSRVTLLPRASRRRTSRRSRASWSRRSK
jgi:hypothetical protein